MEDAVTTGAGTVLGPGCWIRHGTELTGAVLSAGVFLGFRCRIAGAHFGAAAMAASLARVGAPGGATVEIGPGAWIGAAAEIVPGVRIGAGAVVAAGAHVAADVPDDTVVVGRPARVLRRRQVVEDGLPDMTATVRAVRRRPDRNKAPLPDGWLAGPGVVLDADLAGGPDVLLGPGVITMGRATGPSPHGGLRVGRGTRIGAGAVVEGSAGIDLGAGVDLGAGALVVSSGHDLGRRSLPWQAGPVVIGDHAVIGAGAVLIGPLCVGAGARVAPGAVVVADVPPGHTTYGVLERNAPCG